MTGTEMSKKKKKNQERGLPWGEQGRSRQGSHSLAERSWGGGGTGEGDIVPSESRLRTRVNTSHGAVRGPENWVGSWQGAITDTRQSASPGPGEWAGHLCPWSHRSERRVSLLMLVGPLEELTRCPSWTLSPTASGTASIRAHPGPGWYQRLNAWLWLRAHWG